jgi:type I restriction enzyme, S subunit
MKPYTKYKPTNIEWIGEIPEHWVLSKLNYLADKIGDGIHSTPEYVENSEFCFINGNNLVEGNITFFENTKFVSKSEFEKYHINLMPKKTVLLSINGTIGNLAIYNSEKVILGKSACYITCKHILNSMYLYYTLKSDSIFKYFNFELTGTTIYNLSLNSIRKAPIPQPPFPEQQAIVSYLDTKTTLIDELISKKEQKIELLKENRTAIINHAVTKGLDDTVAYKDSGIEWIGEIPEHWKQVKVKNIAKVYGRIGYRGYTVEDIVEEGEGAITISPSNIYKDIFNLNSNTYISWEKYHESPEIKIFKDDIIIVKTGSTIGKTAIIPDFCPEMTINPQLVVLKHITLWNKYFYYNTICDFFKESFHIEQTGSTTPTISQEKIYNFPVIVPPTKEQEEIVAYLDAQTALIDKAVQLEEQKIATLKEYRQALISDVVTGKVSVL